VKNASRAWRTSWRDSNVGASAGGGVATRRHLRLPLFSRLLAWKGALCLYTVPAPRIGDA